MGMVGEGQMRCKRVVFHLLSVDYMLAAWQLVRSGMTGYLLLAYFLSCLVLKERNNCSCFGNLGTVAAAD